MSDKWERSLIVPGGVQDDQQLEQTRRLVGYGIRAVFSRGLRERNRSLPLSYLQSHRGFPRQCPEQYCAASIRPDAGTGCFLFHGRGQILSCYKGHRFVCFRFGRFMVVSKLDLYLARVGAAKWQRVIEFPARSAYGRGLLRAMWNTPYEEVLCGCANAKEPAVVARWRGLRRRFARELGETDRALIRSRVDTCLDLCWEGLQVVRDYVSAVELACPRGHHVLVSKSERGTFVSSRLNLSLSFSAETL
ncbi:MAG: hypothetical protein ACE5I7_03780 [Candidatus Binatia bacterium]